MILLQLCLTADRDIVLCFYSGCELVISMAIVYIFKRKIILENVTSIFLQTFPS